MRDGGVVIVAVPFIHRVHGAPSDFWRLTDTALRMLCEQAGLRKVRIQAIGGVHFWLLLLFSYLSDAILFQLIRLLRKGVPLIGSYPLAYLVYAWKGADGR